MRKWLVVIVVLVVLGGLIAWRFQKNGKAAAEAGAGAGKTGQMGKRMGQGPASVELASPQVRDIEQNFQATGSIESIQNVQITPKVSGTIESIAVREGDSIRQGQMLVRIDQEDVQAQVRQQQAALAEAKARLAQAKLNWNSTDPAVKSQIDQQQANLESASAGLTQAKKTRDAQLEAINASVEDAKSKIDAATASVANATAALHSAQANLENANTKFNRINELYKQGYIAAQDVDDARTTVSVQQSTVDVANGQLQSATAALSSAQAQKRSIEQQVSITQAKVDADVETARAKVAQAQAALDNAKANTTQTPAYQENLNALRASMAVAEASLDSARAKLEDTVLRSPLNGVVTARNQDTGGMASPGQAILTVQSINSLWVTVAVPEDVCVKLHLNQTAKVTVDALGDRTFTARIAQINPAADPQSRQFTVRVALDNSRHLFTPGMFARVTLVTEKASNVLAVPREAVEQSPDGQSYVFAVGKDQKAHQRSVVTGTSDADWTGIIAGLEKTEKVVTMSAMPLRDGQMVSQGKGRRGGKGKAGRGQPGSAPADRKAGDTPGRSERRPGARQ